ncbi:MAG: CpsD/CapB family tyrosine-protein kinase [Steroidobacteraceae bacterium]
MSIVEKTLGKLRSDRVRESVVSARAQLRPGPVKGPPHARTLSIQAAEDDAVRAFWEGRVEQAVVSHMRGLRRELLAQLQPALDSGIAPLVLVTSALPGDGKTFVSTAIARTFSKAPDLSVVLVDLDLVRRSCSKLFGAADLPGLVDCARGANDMEDVICATEVPRLTMVPAGIGAGEQREAFVGDGLISQLERLRQAGPGTINILDAPPVLPVVETSLLATKVDLVLLVVRAGTTPQAAVLESLARLGPDAKVCIALNSVVHSHTGEYYDYSNYGSNVPRSAGQ